MLVHSDPRALPQVQCMQGAVPQGAMRQFICVMRAQVTSIHTEWALLGGQAWNGRSYTNPGALVMQSIHLNSLRAGYNMLGHTASAGTLGAMADVWQRCGGGRLMLRRPGAGESSDACATLLSWVPSARPLTPVGLPLDLPLMCLCQDLQDHEGQCGRRGLPKSKLRGEAKGEKFCCSACERAKERRSGQACDQTDAAKRQDRGSRGDEDN